MSSSLVYLLGLMQCSLSRRAADGSENLVDMALTVTDDDVKEGLNPSISTTQSTAVTDSTTKSWKVAGKISGVK